MSNRSTFRKHLKATVVLTRGEIVALRRVVKAMQGEMIDPFVANAVLVALEAAEKRLKARRR